MNPRQVAKEALLNDLSRSVVADHKISKCEGQAFVPHICIGGLEMNEVIFTRNHIQHISGKAREYFWYLMNCSINCSFFHHNFGHSTEFRDWFVKRIIDLYGQVNVAEYILTAKQRGLLKFTEYAWVYEPYTQKGKK